MFAQYSNDIILTYLAVEKFEDTIKRLEAMSKDHGQTSTSASVSGSQESLWGSES